MVTAASFGPIAKSFSLTGGKRESELGAEVASAVIAEQLIAEVGVLTIMGVVTMAVCVGVMVLFDEHAPSMNMLAISKNNITLWRSPSALRPDFGVRFASGDFALHEKVLKI